MNRRLRLQQGEYNKNQTGHPTPLKSTIVRFSRTEQFQIQSGDFVCVFIPYGNTHKNSFWTAQLLWNGQAFMASDKKPILAMKKAFQTWRNR